MTTTAPEILSSLSTSWSDAVQRWVDQSQAMWGQWAPGVDQSHHHHEGHAHHQQMHGDRCCDPCACCVPEADVVIRARAGERRVVPFRLHNRWRREREVTLSVGPWHVCSGDGLVVSARMEEEQVTLQPCEDRLVRLVVTVAAGENDDNGADLGMCASAYADVRFEGCARPQRVAVVASPDRCGPVDVDCDCACC